MKTTTSGTLMFRCFDPDRMDLEDAAEIEERTMPAAAEEYVSRHFSARYWENATVPVSVVVVRPDGVSARFSVEIRMAPEFYATRSP